MILLIDDIFLRMVGVSLGPLDLIWILEQIRDYAYQEAYNLEKITEEMKENDLLYELGEITEEEYERRRSELMERLKLAKRIEETGLEERMGILDYSAVGRRKLRVGEK